MQQVKDSTTRIPLIFVLSPGVKQLYWQAEVDNKTTLFIFNDTQVVEEGFLEDINNFLSSGEVPNLYKPDEFEEVLYTPLALN
uniref:Dynein heavy chain AAA module D4 domain-containing protein n=1 Tax=Magallana gigas TaxID=29159 RepID=A0A8W8IGK7_MAGGI